MSIFRDEHIGKPVCELPDYKASYLCTYEVDGEKVEVVGHFFEGGSAQFHFMRGDKKDGIALTKYGLAAIDALREIDRRAQG